MKLLLLVVLIIPLLYPSAACSLERDEIRPLLASIRIKEPLDFCGEDVPLHLQDVRERLERELLLTLWNRPQVILWLKRSRRYLPAVEEVLSKYQAPLDLRFLAVAESALIPHAFSSKKASGFWQFIAPTGKKYGLRIGSGIDERRHLGASTKAAVTYLKELRARFGSWTMAAAAYNMGEEGLSAEIIAQGVENYYLLYLPKETERFVFKILSAKLIMLDPKKYGFNLEEDDYYQPLSFDTVTVDCPEQIPLQIIAKSAGTYFRMIKELNPHIKGHFLSKGTHEIMIPKGAAKTFHSRYARLASSFVAGKREMVYVVKEGDTLSAIAKRFDVPLNALLIWNEVDTSRPIKPGHRLIVFRPQLSEPDKFNEEDN